MYEENQINSITKGEILKNKKKYNSNCKGGWMGQSVIKKEWDCKYPIFSFMWLAAPRQEEERDFKFSSTKIESKTPPKLLGYTNFRPLSRENIPWQRN